MQWISYCDYAFPHSLHYDGAAEVCEGLWIYIQLNDEEPSSFNIEQIVKYPIGIT